MYYFHKKDFLTAKKKQNKNDIILYVSVAINIKDKILPSALTL